MTTHQQNTVVSHVLAISSGGWCVFKQRRHTELQWSRDPLQRIFLLLLNISWLVHYQQEQFKPISHNLHIIYISDYRLIYQGRLAFNAVYFFSTLYSLKVKYSMVIVFFIFYQIRRQKSSPSPSLSPQTHSFPNDCNYIIGTFKEEQQCFQLQEYFMVLQWKNYKQDIHILRHEINNWELY